MKRNYIINKAETQVRKRQYYQERFNLNQTYDSINPFVKNNEVNLNDTSSTYYTNNHSYTKYPYNSSNRSSSNKQRRGIIKLNHYPEVTNFFINNQQAKINLSSRGGSLNVGRQQQSNGEYLQFYVNERQEYPYEQRYGQDSIPPDSFQTPQKTKETAYYYYPDSQQKSISPPKHSKYEKVYQESFSDKGRKGVNSTYKREDEEDNNLNQLQLEPAHEVPTVEEESNEFLDQSGINEAYFSINDSNIHYSDIEPQQDENSPVLNRKMNRVSKLGEAKRRAVSQDRNFVDNSYNYQKNPNNSTLNNNSSWIFYQNKIKNQQQINAEEAIFGDTAKSGDFYNPHKETTENNQIDQEKQQYNSNHLRKYYAQNRKYEKILEDVRINGSRFYIKPQKPKKDGYFNPENENQIKYLNQISLPKHLSEINNQKQFFYRKCECGNKEDCDSPRNLYKREGKCKNSFYQNTTINF